MGTPEKIPTESHHSATFHRPTASSKVHQVTRKFEPLPKLESEYVFVLLKEILNSNKNSEGKVDFEFNIDWLFMVFKEDIDRDTYKKFIQDIFDEKIEKPKIIVVSKNSVDFVKLDKQLGAFDEYRDFLLIDLDLVKNAKTDDNAKNTLFLVIAELTGYYFENLLRRRYSVTKGYSAKEKGSPFAYQLYRDSTDTALLGKMFAVDKVNNFNYNLVGVDKLAKSALKVLETKKTIISKPGYMYIGQSTDTKRWLWKDTKPFATFTKNHLNYPDLFTRIEQRAELYLWVYEQARAMGHKILWPLAAHIVSVGAMQVSLYDTAVGNNVIAEMALRGNQCIFDNVLPKLKKLLDTKPLNAKDSLIWDMETLAEEQFFIQAMYRIYDKIDTTYLNDFQQIGKTQFWGSPASAIGSYMGSISCAIAATGVCKDKGTYNKFGKVPYFPGSWDMRKVRDRWRFGMLLALSFKPDGLPFDESKAMKDVDKLLVTVFDHKKGKFKGMPGKGIIEGKFLDGSEFKRLDVKFNAHKFLAELDDTHVDESLTPKLFKKLNVKEYYMVREDPKYGKYVYESANLSDIKGDYYSSRVDMKAYQKYLESLK